MLWLKQVWVTMGAPTRVTNLNDYIRLQRGEKKENRKKESSLLKLDWVISLEVTVISGMAAFNHENLKIIHLGKGKRSVALNVDLSSNLAFTILYIKCGSFVVSSELLFLYLKFCIITGFHYEGYIYLYWKTMEVLAQASLRGSHRYAGKL